MVELSSLVLPILVAALFVFLVSFLLHMVLPFHRSDFSKLPSEDAVLEALRKFNIPEGDYVFPHGGGPEAMKNPDHIEKCKKGPIGMLTMWKPAAPAMGSSLVQWFLYCVLAGILAGSVAGQSLAPGAPYLSVFCIVCTTAFGGYSLALLQNSIWYKRKWSTTLKSMFDGLIYALVTAGTFGWLWPGV